MLCGQAPLRSSQRENHGTTAEGITSRSKPCGVALRFSAWLRQSELERPRVLQDRRREGGRR